MEWDPTIPQEFLAAVGSSGVTDSALLLMVLMVARKLAPDEDTWDDLQEDLINICKQSSEV